MKLAFALPMFILLSVFACKKPSGAPSETVWKEKIKPAVELVHLNDTIPTRYISGLQIKEIHGVRASYPSGRYTSYYEYDGDVNTVLRMIASLPFKKSNAISDTTCRSLSNPFSTRGKILVADEELEAAKFFWQINPKEYDYYECLKNPTRHTILVHKTTGRILHRIESILQV